MFYKLLERIAETMGLRPQMWLSWENCVPDWIVPYFWWFGLFIAVSYLIFAVCAFKLEKKGARLLKVRNFFVRLGVVFILCFSIHLLNVHSKYEPILYVPLIFLYPALAVAMTRLVFVAYRVYYQLDRILHINEVRELLEKRDNEIARLKKEIEDSDITQMKVDIAKKRLELLSEMQNAFGEHTVIEGEDWELPIFYDRWTTYKMGNMDCRLIGIYPNHDTTAIINEFPPCVFPPHQHKFTEAIVVLEGEFTVAVEGEERLLKPGDVVHAPYDMTHSMSTETGGVLIVVWGRLFEDNTIRATG